MNLIETKIEKIIVQIDDKIFTQTKLKITLLNCGNKLEKMKIDQHGLKENTLNKIKVF